MKRMAKFLLVSALGVGCGGSQEAATTSLDKAPSPPAVAQTTPVPDPAKTVVDASPSPQSKPEAKKPDDGPGLVLPEEEPDTVGSKGLELPIR